jgi:hypothetical protein
VNWLLPQSQQRLQVAVLSLPQHQHRWRFSRRQARQARANLLVKPQRRLPLPARRTDGPQRLLQCASAEPRRLQL